MMLTIADLCWAAIEDLDHECPCSTCTMHDELLIDAR
jgi:hypothetical protein